MPPISYILTAFILPAALVAAGMWFRRRWLNAIIFPLAWAISQWAIHGRPPGPPGTGDTIYWIFWFAAPLAAIALLDSVFRLPLIIRTGIYFVVALVVLHLLLGKLPIQLAIVLAIVTCASMYWTSVEHLAERNPGITAPAVLVIQCLGAAILLGSENNGAAAHGAGALTAMATAASAISLLRTNISISRGPILTISITLTAMLVYAHFYAYPDLPNSSFLYAGIILLAPLLAWAGDLPGIRTRPPWARLAIRVLPVLLAVGSASALSLHEYLSGSPPGQNSSGAEEE